MDFAISSHAAKSPPSCATVAAAMAAAPIVIPAASVSTTFTVPGNTADAATAADHVDDSALDKCRAITPSSPPRSSWRA